MTENEKAPDAWYESAADAAAGGITLGGRDLGHLVDAVVEACWALHKDLARDTTAPPQT